MQDHLAVVGQPNNAEGFPIDPVRAFGVGELPVHYTPCLSMVRDQGASKDAFKTYWDIKGVEEEDRAKLEDNMEKAMREHRIAALKHARGDGAIDDSDMADLLPKLGNLSVFYNKSQIVSACCTAASNSTTPCPSDRFRETPPLKSKFEDDTALVRFARKRDAYSGPNAAWDFNHLVHVGTGGTWWDVATMLHAHTSLNEMRIPIEVVRDALLLIKDTVKVSVRETPLARGDGKNEQDKKNMDNGGDESDPNTAATAAEIQLRQRQARALPLAALAAKHEVCTRRAATAGVLTAAALLQASSP